MTTLLNTQLSLDFQLGDDTSFETFIPGENQEALAAVLEMAAEFQGSAPEFKRLPAAASFVYLFGRSGVGCTHLLQAACRQASTTQVSAVYIPLKKIASLSPILFQGLEHLSLVCIDDLECLAGNAPWEEALFHLYNRLLASNKRLLVAAHQPPALLPIRLLDLKSRLNAGVAYQLHPLNDEQKLNALMLRAKHRGLELSASVGQFLLNRAPREMTELFHYLERLDSASLAEQRRLTIPFVKQVLNL